MKPWVVALFAAVALGCASAPPARNTAAQPDLAVWHQFLALLRAGPFPAERIRPYDEGLRESNLRVLEKIRREASPRELARTPEVFRVGQQIHYLLPLTLNEGKATYTFTFVLDGDRWYYQHLDAIAIRLDRLGPLPVSKFPDLPEATKGWMRAESDVTKQVWLYKTVAAEKGPDEARRWLNDGAGYALTARVWIPFVEPGRAFVLYLCWEQANLRGNAVSLERLDEDEAVVRFTPEWFLLYRIAGHLRGQIALEEYRRLFESIWQDRAANAGWRVDFAYRGDEVVMHLRRARREA